MRTHDPTAVGHQHPSGNALSRGRTPSGSSLSAVLEFMQRHPSAITWGRSDLASSDMMSMETTKRVWQARLHPRRNTPSIGIYSHVRDRWGIFHAQPFVLNERQAGAAIEGVVRQERIETSQLAVGTHGYTDFAMALARLLGFDLCPRLKELKQRQLYVPRGMAIPAEETRSTRPGCNLARCCAQRFWLTISSIPPSGKSCAGCSTAARRSTH